MYLVLDLFYVSKNIRKKTASNFSVKIKKKRKLIYHHVLEDIFLIVTRMNKISGATFRQYVTHGGIFLIFHSLKTH